MLEDIGSAFFFIIHYKLAPKQKVQMGGIRHPKRITNITTPDFNLFLVLIIKNFLPQIEQV